MTVSPEYYTRTVLLRKYGLTVEEYDNLLERQNSCCAICGKKSQARLHVDHDHETGEVRGLLCSNCNTGLGMFKDSPRLLAAAIVYLEDHGRPYPSYS